MHKHCPKEIFDELDRSRGFFTDGALKALSSVVYEDSNKLRVLCTVLQQSEETVCVATEMLREYGKWYKSIECCHFISDKTY